MDSTFDYISLFKPSIFKESLNQPFVRPSNQLDKYQLVMMRIRRVCRLIHTNFRLSSDMRQNAKSSYAMSKFLKIFETISNPLSLGTNQKIRTLQCKIFYSKLHTEIVEYSRIEAS